MDGAKGEKGKIGVLGAAAIGIGGMVGGGIFAVLGTAVLLTGGGAPVAFAIAGFIALLTAHSYSKLSVAFPQSGGTIVFLDRAFGIDACTGTLNGILWLSYLVTIALYAAAFGSYGLTFFTEKPSWLLHLLVSGAIVLPAVLNVLSAAIVSKTETLVVTIKLTLLALVIAFGAGQVDVERLAPSTWESPLSLVVGGMVIFVAYEGFELIANAADEVRTPAITLPRAFYLCVGFVVILYILVAVVTVGSVAPSEIVRAKDYALAAAAEPALGQAGFVLVSISALLATFSAINATIYGNARLGFTLAKDGELPKIFERKTWTRPLFGVLLTAGLSLIIANFVPLDAIAIIGSAGFLLIFAAVNAAAFRLRKKVGANRFVTGAATTVCLLALVALLIHTAQTSPQALFVFAGLIALAGAFEIVYPAVTKRTFSGLRRSDSAGEHPVTVRKASRILHDR